MTIVKVHPGICGMISTIKAVSEDGQMVNLEIESVCPSITALNEALKTVDAYQVCFAKFSASPVYQAADENFKHAACPVPAAIIKAIEAEAGLALAKDVSVVIEKE